MKIELLIRHRYTKESSPVWLFNKREGELVSTVKNSYCPEFIFVAESKQEAKTLRLLKKLLNGPDDPLTFTMGNISHNKEAKTHTAVLQSDYWIDSGSELIKYLDKNQE